MNQVEILELEKKDEREWDEFVKKSNDSTFYHQIGWKNVVGKTYRHKPIYLMAKEDDELRGILPLFLMKSKFFGNKLVSVPFAPYGGICSYDNLTLNLLFDEAKTIRNELGVEYLEFRNCKKYEVGSTNKSYFTLVLDLNSDSNFLWNSLRKSMRRYIRKARDNNFEFTIKSNDLKNFYNLYSKNMRDLGTPAHSYNFFENILREFPENTKIAMIRYEDNFIASLFLLNFKKTVIYGWGASDKRYLTMYPNYLLFWESIKHSCENGYIRFDLGRSMINEGTFLFKKGWGAKPKQLYYQYYLKGNHIVDSSKSNPKRQMFAKLWKKLPVSIANALGSKLRKNFP